MAEKPEGPEENCQQNMSNISQRSRQRSRQRYRVAISQALLQQIREPRLGDRNVNSSIRISNCPDNNNVVTSSNSSNSNNLSPPQTNCVPNEFSCDTWVSNNISQDNRVSLEIEPIGFPIDIELREWTVRHNIKHSALRDLLSILNKTHSFSLPIDPRTLMKTPRKLNISVVSGGDFYYFGIVSHLVIHVKYGLQQTAKTAIYNTLRADSSNPIISITVGIDGIPISKSSNKQFWPILGIVDQSCDRTPFVIALYYAEHKPTNLDLLQPFVEECKALEQDGIIISGILYTFRISRILADAPARSYIKGIKNHNSYFSCERCHEEGEWNGRVTFLNTEFRKRTNENFVLQTDTQHHKEISPLTKLCIGLVSQVPLDYLHLVCLGVTRKLFRMWVKGRIPFKLPAGKILAISERLSNFREHFPSDIPRKPRSLLQIDHFKGTEFRTLLLYTGIVALRDIIKPREYRNYLRFHAAIYILLSPRADNSEWNLQAAALLKKFVKGCMNLYGNEFMVYNVHGLLHINDDALLFGSLDNASCFPFENYMQKIKILLSSHNFQLEQVVKRIIEMDLVRQDMNAIQKISENKKFSPKSSCKNGNNCFMLRSGGIVILQNYTYRKNDSVEYTCQQILNLHSVQYYPFDSSNLKIYFSSGLSEPVNMVLEPEDFLFKYIRLPYNSEFLLVPLLHSIKI